MYRSDLGAAQARADALEQELDELRAAHDRDAARIARLEGELQLAPRQLAMVPVPQMAPALPSNSTAVLVLGILSVVACPLVGPFAWATANGELARIQTGLHDPSRRGEVVAGKVMGIIGTGLSLCVVLFFLLLTL